jgi:plasmid stabilization system protein ParE
METLSLRFANRAERQIDDILSYIALDNPDAAQKIAEHIETLMAKVLAYPDMGRKIFDDLPYREVQAYPCRLIYRRIEPILWVVAVLRVEQLLRRNMLEG